MRFPVPQLLEVAIEICEARVRFVRVYLGDLNTEGFGAASVGELKVGSLALFHDGELPDVVHRAEHRQFHVPGCVAAPFSHVGNDCTTHRRN